MNEKSINVFKNHSGYKIAVALATNVGMTVAAALML